jgi:predicted nucleic acid-binding protein
LGGRFGRNSLQPLLILIDSSVWINNLRGHQTLGVQKLKAIQETTSIVIGDLILMEILMGARSEGQAVRLREALDCFPVLSLCDASIADLAARNYRHLRGLGATTRKGIDLVIGTFCIEHDHHLLHDDRDFEPMVKYLGLKTV